MTREEIRQKAILAAATVVMAMGCGAHARGEAAPEAPAAETSAVAGGAKPECAEVAVESLSDCCQSLSTWCEANAAEQKSECVFGPGLDGSTGCIPWGPAVPPRA